jgi:hypothetical protein
MNTNLKNLLSKSLAIFSSVAGAASIAGYINQVKDEKLYKNFLKIQKDNEILREQISDIKIDELKHELTKSKVETLRSSLELSQNKISNELEEINKLDNNLNKDVIESHLDNLNKEGENINSAVNEIINILNDKTNKFISEFNIFENIKLFYNK